MSLADQSLFFMAGKRRPPDGVRRMQTADLQTRAHGLAKKLELLLTKLALRLAKLALLLAKIALRLDCLG